MFDELDRLRNNPRLVELLAHYARLGEPDREIWQDRLMQMEGLAAPELVKLHGELIAFRWVDQNTGQVPVVKAGEVPGCYRITAQGRKALRQVQGLESVDEEGTTQQVPEKPVLKFPKKKRTANSEPAPETPPVAA